jgi:hypothetical protein
MTELSTDFFASLEQCNFPMPALTRYDVFPQFDPSSFIAPLDPPDSTNSGSDNEPPNSPSLSIISSPLSPSPPYHLGALNPSTIGIKRKNPTEIPVTLPGTVVEELIKSQEEKKSRLARKAELARQSRRKKKMRLSDLENEVAELQGELAQAKEEIKRLTLKNNSLLNTQPTIKELNIEHLMDNILKAKGPTLMCPPPPPSLSASPTKKNEEKTSNDLKIEQLVPELLLSLQKESSSVNSSLQALQQALVPNMAIQFLEWTLTRGDHFYSEATQFGHLFYETMQSTPTQVLALLALRKASNEDFKLKDAKVMEALEIVKNALTQRSAQVETFTKLRSIFTPHQLATYLQYVKMFGHVLVKVPA